MGKKNILLTGASGDLGKFLVKKISKYHNIKILTRKYVKLVPLQNQFIFKDFTKITTASKVFSKIDIVIHLAGMKNYEDKYCNLNELIKSNILITKSLFLYCRKYKIKKFIFLSTIKVNFLKNDTRKNNLNKSSDPYALSKKIAEDQIIRLRNKFTDLIVIRSAAFRGHNNKNSVNKFLTLEKYFFFIPNFLFNIKLLLSCKSKLSDFIINCCSNNFIQNKVIYYFFDKKLYSIGYLILKKRKINKKKTIKIYLPFFDEFFLFFSRFFLKLINKDSEIYKKIFLNNKVKLNLLDD